MNSLDRVLSCLRHERADRLPLDGYFRDEVWHMLGRHFGTDDREEIQRALGIDFRTLEMQLPADFRARAEKTPRGRYIPHPDGSLEDEWGTRIRFDADGRYYRFVYHPLSDESAFTAYRFPSLQGRLPPPRTQRDVAVLAQNSNLFKLCWHIRGLDQTLMDLVANVDFLEVLLDKALSWQLELVRQQAQWGVDILGAVGDIAMQDRMLMRPDVWRRLFKPREARVIEEGRRYGVGHFYFHSDGDLRAVLDDLVEIGVDIINPVQPECMDPVEIKKRYGNRLTMHGTISAQRTLPFGTPQDVANEVAERINTCGYNGGLVLAPNNVVQPDVPLPNLLALYDTVKAIGRKAYR